LKKFVELLCKYSDIQKMDLVEKDLLLHFLLKRISNNEYLQENLIFKGGTCLIKAYFGYYRFSEDLDFTWKDQVCFSGKSGKQQRKILKEIINDIGATFKDIASELNMHFVPDKNDRKYVELGGSNRMLTFKIWYDSGVLNRTGFIKIQINFIETVLFQPVERSLKNHLIEYIPKEKLMELEFLFPEYTNEYFSEIDFTCYDLREIFIEKCRAILTRKAQKSRDFVDLYMLHRNSGLSIKDLEDLIIIKMLFSLQMYQKYRDNFQQSDIMFFDLENGDEDKLLLVEIGDSFYEYLKECKNELVILRERIVSSAQM